MDTYAKNYNMDIAIIGAGLAGLATAYHLAERTDYKIRIFDKEPEPGLGASTKNASMLCRLSPDPVLSRLMSSSIDGIKLDWLRRFKYSLKLNECGSWHIGSKCDLKSFLESASALQEMGVDVAIMGRGEAVRREPELIQATFEQAVWCPADGVFPAENLIKTLVEHLKSKGVSFYYLNNMHTEPANDRDIVLTNGEQKYRARFVINAGGAWGSVIHRDQNAGYPEYTILKRHLFVTRPLPEKYQRKRPIIWDVTDHFYMRPEKSSQLMSACDNTPCGADLCKIDPDRYSDMESKLKRFGVDWSDTKFMRVWSGLRTFSPDGRPIIGRDFKYRQLYWITCLGGYGLTASYQAGKILADQILGYPSTTSYEEAFSPSRFTTQTPITTPADYR